jgi:hypothetical protein
MIGVTLAQHEGAGRKLGFNFGGQRGSGFAGLDVSNGRLDRAEASPDWTPAFKPLPERLGEVVRRAHLAALLQERSL